MPNADIVLPKLPAGTFSFADPNAIVQQLLELIDRAWAERQHCPDGQSYARIILVGHSLGALLARKVYVCACGQNADAPFEPEIVQRGEPTREWASKVERIILFAGMNRGWTISHHLPLQKAILIRLGVFIGDILKLIRRRRLLYFQMRRGAPFITQLRIQWLSLLRHASMDKQGLGNALVIQLLGSIDDLVAPDDNLDLVTGQNFIYLDVPRSGHGNKVTALGALNKRQFATETSSYGSNAAVHL